MEPNCFLLQTARSIWSEVETAVQMTNSGLRWDGLERPQPLLWLRGGHPSLPATHQLFDSERKILALAALMR